MMATTSAGALTLDQCFQRVLDGYLDARRKERFGRNHPLWSIFLRLASVIQESGALGTDGKITLRWSIGQGRWATVPWVAMLDFRETSKITAGFYVAYLFCEDMSGVAISLNQGSSDLMASHGMDAEALLRARADLIAAALPNSLPVRGWMVGKPLDLNASTKLTRAYNVGSAVHKMYRRGKLPSEATLLADLGMILEAYKNVVPTERLKQGRE